MEWGGKWFFRMMTSNLATKLDANLWFEGSELGNQWQIYKFNFFAKLAIEGSVLELTCKFAYVDAWPAVQVQLQV